MMRIEGKLAFINPTNAPAIIMFKCPGCGENHGLNDTWKYNGNPHAPTFSPSVLARGTRFTAKGQADYEAWCAAGHPKRNDPFESVDYVCHSFVTDGKIQFLGDCTHELRGQTVDLPEWDAT